MLMSYIIPANTARWKVPVSVAFLMRRHPYARRTPRFRSCAHAQNEIVPARNGWNGKNGMRIVRFHQGTVNVVNLPDEVANALRWPTADNSPPERRPCRRGPAVALMIPSDTARAVSWPWVMLITAMPAVRMMRVTHPKRARVPPRIARRR